MDGHQWGACRRSPSPPRVNFAEEQLLIVGMGSFPSGGFAIRIDSVLAQPNALTAYVGSEYWCGATAMAEGPVDIVRVARRFGAVRFVNAHRGDPACLDLYGDREP